MGERKTNDMDKITNAVAKLFELPRIVKSRFIDTWRMKSFSDLVEFAETSISQKPALEILRFITARTIDQLEHIRRSTPDHKLGTRMNRL